jgi:hypothetical protein
MLERRRKMTRLRERVKRARRRVKANKKFEQTRPPQPAQGLFKANVIGAVEAAPERQRDGYRNLLLAI